AACVDQALDDRARDQQVPQRGIGKPQQVTPDQSGSRLAGEDRRLIGGRLGAALHPEARVHVEALAARQRLTGSVGELGKEKLLASKGIDAGIPFADSHAVDEQERDLHRGSVYPAPHFAGQGTILPRMTARLAPVAEGTFCGVPDRHSLANSAKQAASFASSGNPKADSERTGA